MTNLAWFQAYVERHRSIEYKSLAASLGVSKQSVYLAMRGIAGPRVEKAIAEFKAKAEK